MKHGLCLGLAVISFGAAVGLMTNQPVTGRAVATVRPTPTAVRGSWFQEQDLKYRVKITKSTFVFGGGYYAGKKWHPIDQQSYQVSRKVKQGTCTWSKQTNANGYYTVKIKNGKFLVKAKSGILTVKEYRNGKDVNGYPLYFHHIKNAAAVLSGDTK
ncbi:hypothetical protein [Levilactobacillus fujinensis]|uniref:Surface layer protein A domain-containing protein n=1 Tax=Levilactobacillus fujinensis TaxID=2486024 RepID=A0ABW1THM9_9LACO|nr:hypothetical protein [Levilactobacillus fujinensis]